MRQQQKQKIKNLKITNLVLATVHIKTTPPVAFFLKVMFGGS
jgi:hypothetical protein